MADASECYEHVTGDSRVAECFEFQVGSMPGSVYTLQWKLAPL